MAGGEGVGYSRSFDHKDAHSHRGSGTRSKSSSDLLSDDDAEDIPIDRLGERRTTLSQFNSDSMHSFSFASQARKRESFVGAARLQTRGEMTPPNGSNATAEDFELNDFLPDREDGPLFPTTSRNPHKALLTIDLRDSSVLVANNVACDMFACTPSEIVGVRFPDLLAYSLDRARQNDLIESNIDADGKVVMVKGKVVDVINSHGGVFPVSLWMKMLTVQPQPRCIAVMEPVERSSAVLALNKDGVIVHTDGTAKAMFGYEASELVGRTMCHIVNAFRLPDPDCTTSEDFDKDVLIQEATAGLKSGQRCPVSVAVRARADTAGGSSFPHDHAVFKHPDCALCVVVWIYANLSGLMTVRENGAIHSCNSSFSRRLFGYDESDLVGKEMSLVLPDLFNILTLSQSQIPSPCGSDDSVDVPLPRLAADLASSCDDSDVDGDVFSASAPMNKRLEAMRLPVTSTPDAALTPNLSSADIDQRHSTASPTLRSSGTSTTVESIGPLRSLSSGMHELVAPGGYRSASAASYHQSSSASPFQSEFLRNVHSASGGGLVMSPRLILSPVAHRHTPVSRTSGSRGASSLSQSWRATQQQWADRGQLDVSRITGVTLPTTVRHRDATSLDVLAQVKTVILDNSQTLFCVWIQRDANVEVDPLCRLDQSYLNISLAKHGFVDSDYDDDSGPVSRSASKKSVPSGAAQVAALPEEPDSDDSGEDEDEPSMGGSSLGGGLQRATNTVASFASTLGQSCILGDDEEARQMFAGDYESNYMTLKSIGKGAFGEVKLAISRFTSRSVVIKFIRKTSVLKESWKDLTDEEFNAVSLQRSDTVKPQLPERPLAVPLEIVLLRRLEHPNIVKAIEVYENDEYYQMVMERHGHGMDLFEFIDQNPRMDEPLTSYIFRQIAQAIQYLHSNGIVHRDVKDENVIIDDDFNIKLIDFGSAAYMEPSRLFATFCGTLEFCSPEVLLGNRYPGPELEMWSLGVTLYTLVFGENPFVEAEDILTGQLQPPFRVSPGLLKILLWLLHPDPQSRATIDQLLNCAWMRMEVDISAYRFDEVVGGGAGATSGVSSGVIGHVEASISESMMNSRNGTSAARAGSTYAHSHSLSGTV
eukprot:scpid17025/ scgid35707/ PAS domain-containing serine/threonine-protein kinase